MPPARCHRDVANPHKRRKRLNPGRFSGTIPGPPRCDHAAHLRDGAEGISAVPQAAARRAIQAFLLVF